MAKIVALRNILVHEYYIIDTAIVWNIIVEDLPDLKKQITALINRVPQM